MIEVNELTGTMAEIKERAINYALQCTEGNRTAAARLLGVTLRTVTNAIRTNPKLRKKYPARANQYTCKNHNATR